MKRMVAIERCADYEPRVLREALARCLAPLGGMAAFVRPGQRVLLKPNFVLPRPLAEAANTHPHLVLAVAELVRAAGGEPVIGDSPALGRARSVARKIGLCELAEKANVPIIEFTQAVAVTPPGASGPVKVAKEILDADVVINLPKLKAHQQLRLTGAVKNLFGGVKGRRKAFLHFKLGHNPARFADMLLDTMLAIQPALTIIDAIVAMERWGPTKGDPLTLGLLLAGADPVALDAMACELLQIDSALISTQAAARRRGFEGADRANISLAGVPPAELRLPPFRLPDRLLPIRFGLAHIVRGIARQFKSYYGRGQKEA